MDRILISSPGTPNTGNLATGDAAAESVEIPMLIAVQGHFDAAKVRQVFTWLGAKPQSYNSFQVYRPQGKSTKNMACGPVRRRNHSRSESAVHLRHARPEPVRSACAPVQPTHGASGRNGRGV